MWWVIFSFSCVASSLTFSSMSYFLLHCLRSCTCLTVRLMFLPYVNWSVFGVSPPLNHRNSRTWVFVMEDISPLGGHIHVCWSITTDTLRYTPEGVVFQRFRSGNAGLCGLTTARISLICSSSPSVCENFVLCSYASAVSVVGKALIELLRKSHLAWSVCSSTLAS